MKILITSVGSLVGQNLLDSLDFPGASRRHLVHVVGTTSAPLAGAAYRADELHWLPETNDASFLNALAAVINRTRPDIVFFGRDEDSIQFLKIRDSLSHIPKAPVGTISSTLIALDKIESFRFSLRQGLSFAQTFKLGTTGNAEQLRKFIDQVGMPIVAKPVRGFASKGVYFLNDVSQVMSFSSREDYLLQEYLGDKKGFAKTLDECSGGIPLFLGTGSVSHYTGHMYISSAGDVSEPFISENHHTAGMTTGFKRVQIEELVSESRRFANAFSLEGGRGHLGMQFRKRENGTWAAQELNNRPNGNTLARCILGQDDLFLAISDLLPKFPFPEIPQRPATDDAFIFKTLKSEVLNAGSVSTLRRKGMWTADEDKA